MQIVSTLIICLLIIIISCYFGHLITNIFKIKEDNKLLSMLINIAVGLAIFILLVNSLSSITKNFHIGVFISFIAVLGIGGWQLKESTHVFKSVQEFLFSKLVPLFKNTPKSFWILFAIINIVFILTAFTTSQPTDGGLFNNHIFNINQLASGTYPAKYPHFPSLDLNYHHGAYILAALVSKLAWAHPEIALDILTIFFVNLCFLTIYAMSSKFLDTNNVTRVIVVTSAFFAWAPLSKFLFNNNELTGNLLDKVSFIAKDRLSIAAELNGSVVHWFFDPPTGLSILFLLIGLYLIYNFFQKEPSITHTLFVALYISCLSILDLSKLIFICVGVVIYIALAYFLPSLNITTMNKSAWLKLIAHTGIFLFTTIVFSILYGNMLYFSKDYPHIFSTYHIVKSLNTGNASALGLNAVMLAIFGLGFYLAYSSKEKWCNFLLPFFVSGLIIPMFITLPGNEAGIFFMNSNLLGAFVVPFALEYIRKQAKISSKNNAYFYIGLAFILCISSALYWLFDNAKKPIISINSNKATLSSLQNLPYEATGKYKGLVKALKSKNISNSSFLSEPEYAEIISASTGLNNPFINTVPLIKINQELVKKYINEYQGDYYPTAFTFNSKILEEQKINWLILTEKFFRYIMTPTARVKLLSAHINNGAKKMFHGNFDTTQEGVKEVVEAYKIAPDKLNRTYAFDSSKLDQIIKSKDHYLSEIAQCPYYGIYSSMSNDFNGDNISDIAFFDDVNKKWHVIYGGNFEEEEIDLRSHILEGYEGNDIFIPIPADYDGDKSTDIALFSRNNGLWLIYNSLGKYIVRKNWGGKIGEMPTPANIDGDLKTDIVALSIEQNQSRTPSLLSSTNYSYSDKYIDLSNQGILVFSDVDGDSKDDYILHKAGLNSVEVLLSSNNIPIKILIGDNSSRIVPADYDGDGKKDIAVWTPTTGIWEIAYAKDLPIGSTTNTLTAQPEPFIGCGATPKTNNNEQPADCGTSIVHFGHIGNIPLPGDYNGDGIDEIATLDLGTYELLILNKDETTTKIDLSRFKGLMPASFIGT